VARSSVSAPDTREAAGKTIVGSSFTRFISFISLGLAGIEIANPHTVHQNLNLTLETPSTVLGVSALPSTERLATGWP
jgi:hypothetical protein